MDAQQQPERKTKYTPAHKRLMDKWRENNRDQFNALCRKASAVYYEKNREKKNKANLEWYHRKKAEKLRLQENTADSPILSI